MTLSSTVEDPPDTARLLAPAPRQRQPAPAARACETVAPCANAVIQDPAMCGIFGGTPELVATDAERLLLHRGPDQQGRLVIHPRGGVPVVIGQTRLNVVYKE